MLSSYYATFAGFIERQATRRWYPVKLVGFILLLACAFQPPPWQTMLYYDSVYPQDDSLLGRFRSQVAHPFTAPSSPPASHQAKTTFRLVPPLLTRALHTGLFGLYLAQVLIGGVMYWALYRLLRDELTDPVAATVLTTGTALTYFGYACLYDFLFFDAIGYAGLVLLLYVRQPVGLTLLTIVAGFTDERALLASLLPMFWHATAAYRHQPAASSTSPLWLRFNWQVGAIGLGWVGYGLLRSGLALHFHLPTHLDAVGLDVLRRNAEWQAIQLGFVSALKSYWVFIALFLVVLIGHRRYGVALLFVGCLLPVGLGAFLVFDITRSLAYVFPAAIISVVLLRRDLSRRSFSQLTLTVSLLAALITSGHVVNGVFYPAGSLPALLVTWLGPPG